MTQYAFLRLLTTRSFELVSPKAADCGLLGNENDVVGDAASEQWIYPTH